MGHFRDRILQWSAGEASTVDGRATDRVIGPDEFTETFEPAMEGKAFETYSRNHFRRVRP